jgi:hypothetical protein
MSAQPALKYIYLPPIAAASIGGLISVVGSYLMSKRIHDTLGRHEKLHERTNDALARLEKRTNDSLARYEKLPQETNEKLNEIQRMLLWWGGSHPCRGVLVWSEQLNRWHSPREKQSSILSQSCSSGRFPTPLHYVRRRGVFCVEGATR